MFIHKMLLRLLVNLRHMAFVAVLFSFVGAALAFAIGASQVRMALAEQGHGGETSVVLLISSLDSFLVALALLYFGYGIHALTAKNAEVTSGDVPRWLVHVIIVILMVLFLDIAWRNRDGAPCDREPDHARGEGRSAVSASWPRARSGGRSTRPVPRTDPQAGEAEDHADPRRAGHGGQRRRQLGGPSPQREVTRGSEAAPSNPARAQAARRWSANQGRTWGNTCRR